MLIMDNNNNNGNSNNNNNNNNNNYDDDDIIVVDDDINMDLDLNQEPIEASRREGLGTLLDELETAHDQIEARIRHLEAVTARARQRQMWRLVHNRPINQTLVSNPNPNPNPTVPNEMKSGKRDSSHLAVDEGNGGFFDCNICLDMASDPILTCCGHLFCWACFFRVKNCNENGAKECPVCKGEVSAETGVTPIYGNGKGGASLAEAGSESAAAVPPRPRARRVEGVRQRRVARSANLVPLADALRRIRMGMSGEERDWMRRERENGTESGGRWRIRTHQFSSVLPEGASSLYSISSALDNAERLVDDLESFVNGGVNGNNNASSSRVEGEDVASSSRIRIRLPTDRDGPVLRELRRRRMG